MRASCGNAVVWMVAVALSVGALAAVAATVIDSKDKKNVKTTTPSRLLTQPEQIPKLLAAGKLAPADVPDPHWRRDGCSACHRGKPTAKNLRTRDMNALCNVCHEGISSHSYIHPVGATPSASMRSRMPASMRSAVDRGGGRVTCITCHDLPMQCLPARAAERGRNPLFFRNGPYRDRTEQCFFCHDASAYERINPHDQLTDAGALREKTCLVCHDDVEKAKRAKSIKDVGFNVQGDLSAMCTGCHPYKPHPGGVFSFGGKGPPNHLVVPSQEVRERMEDMEGNYGYVFPLDPRTGKLFCGTCHDPHERGVIKTAGAAMRGDTKHRLRREKMCVHCHDK